MVAASLTYPTPSLANPVFAPLHLVQKPVQPRLDGLPYGKVFQEGDTFRASIGGRVETFVADHTGILRPV